MTAESFKEKGNEVRRRSRQSTEQRRAERADAQRAFADGSSLCSFFFCVSARCARPQFFKKGDYERVSQSMMCAWQLAAAAGLACGPFGSALAAAPRHRRLCWLSPVQLPIPQRARQLCRRLAIALEQRLRWAVHW